MREIANESPQSNQNEISDRAQKVLNVVSEDQEEIHVSCEVDDSAMEKERGNKMIKYLCIIIIIHTSTLPSM